MISIQCFLTTALMVQSSVAAFTPQVGRIQSTPIRTELQSAVFDSQGDAVFMAKASECANSESCSIEEAESFLHEVLHLKSGCVVGNIRNNDIYEYITIPNEIIAGLRHKIETSAKT